MMSLRERQKQKRREDMLAAARTLFVERGYSRSTMEAIAERAEVGVAGVAERDALDPIASALQKVRVAVVRAVDRETAQQRQLLGVDLEDDLVALADRVQQTRARITRDAFEIPADVSGVEKLAGEIDLTDVALVSDDEESAPGRVVDDGRRLVEPGQWPFFELRLRRGAIIAAHRGDLVVDEQIDVSPARLVAHQRLPKLHLALLCWLWLLWHVLWIRRRRVVSNRTQMLSLSRM